MIMMMTTISVLLQFCDSCNKIKVEFILLHFISVLLQMCGRSTIELFYFTFILVLLLCGHLKHNIKHKT